MNASTNTVSRWTTYIKAAAFLLPAISIGGISCVFLFPKLKQIWRDAGFENSTAQGLMGVSEFLMSYGIFISAATILVLILLEWRNSRWPRYRGISIGVAVFLLNSAVLVLMTAMLASALMAAPALRWR